MTELGEGQSSPDLKGEKELQSHIGPALNRLDMAMRNLLGVDMSLGISTVHTIPKPKPEITLQRNAEHEIIQLVADPVLGVPYRTFFWSHGAPQEDPLARRTIGISSLDYPWLDIDDEETREKLREYLEKYPSRYKLLRTTISNEAGNLSKISEYPALPQTPWEMKQGYHLVTQSNLPITDDEAQNTLETLSALTQHVKRAQ